MKRNRLLLLVLAAALLALAGWWFLIRTTEDPLPRVYAAEIVATFPHDSQAFTEGLFFDGGTLFESTGEEGTSSIRKVNLQDGKVTAERPLPAPYFGEGIVAWKDRLYQLTWKDQKGFIYKRGTFEPLGEFAYSGEGWGMTSDGTSVIMSDGSATLRFLDPDTLAEKSRLDVRANGCLVVKLNELEFIDGEIWANIWQTDLIARIDPATGKVKSFVDVTALGPPNPGVDDVPNGIAYDAAAKRIFVTGKMWPQLYQVRPAAAPTASPVAESLMHCQG